MLMDSVFLMQDQFRQLKKKLLVSIAYFLYW